MNMDRPHFFIPHIKAIVVSTHGLPTNNSRQARIKLPKRRRPGSRGPEISMASNHPPPLNHYTHEVEQLAPKRMVVGRQNKPFFPIGSW